MRLIPFLITCALLGCAVVPPLADESFGLPRVPWQGEAGMAQQFVTATHDGRAVHLQALVDARPGAVRIVLLDPAGRRAASIAWLAQGIEIEHAGSADGPMTGTRVLENLVMAFWPIGQIRSGLSPGLSVSEAAGVRRLMRGDATLIHVEHIGDDRWTGKTVIEDRRAGLQLTVRSRRIGQ